MPRLIHFSRTYPKHNVLAGKPTRFVEKMLYGFYEDEIFKLELNGGYLRLLQTLNPDKSPELLRTFHDSVNLDYIGTKRSTIRVLKHKYKAGESFSPVVWSGKPYHSPVIRFMPDLPISEAHDIQIAETDNGTCIVLDGRILNEDEMMVLISYEGLTVSGFESWMLPLTTGQLIKWDKK